MMFMNSMGARRSHNKDRHAKPYCQCWNRRAPMSCKQLSSCSCGEERDCYEWKWEMPTISGDSWVVLSEDKKQVTFHPFYSSGTAAVRGDTPLVRGYHYYWEVKVLTETYGTDIMIGIGTDKVKIMENQFKFKSLLGLDSESYGMSYKGVLRHGGLSTGRETVGFCRGTIVGIRLDMWQGTLEFCINRQPQGIMFYNLRRHKALYPMVCSTAAQSSMRLTYASSWRASLLVDAAKTLAASSRAHTRIPPGLRYQLRSQFWYMFPNEGRVLDEDEEPTEVERPMQVAAPSVLAEMFPSQFMNGFYVDNVERNYRVVVWE